jgi:hypothetical protein
MQSLKVRELAREQPDWIFLCPATFAHNCQPNVHCLALGPYLFLRANRAI